MKFSLALASLVLSSAFVFAAPATLATVNGKAITSADANAFLAKAAPGTDFSKLDPKMQRQIVDQLVNQVLVKAQADKSGIKNTAAFKAQYAALKDALATEMWIKQQLGKISVTDKEAKAFYDANGDKMKKDGKTIPYDKAKNEIMQYLKLEKFKTQMESLRTAAKVEIKL